MDIKNLISVRGSRRLQIEEDGRIVGDSGWQDNIVTTEGFLNFLVRTLGALANSSQLSHAALGTGGAPASNATVLAGEIGDASNSRKAVTAASVAGSKGLQLTATFASSDSHITVAHNISNIGLFGGSVTQSATLFAGNTYASSSWATNQNVNITYTLNFDTA